MPPHLTVADLEAVISLDLHLVSFVGDQCSLWLSGIV